MTYGSICNSGCMVAACIHGCTAIYVCPNAPLCTTPYIIMLHDIVWSMQGSTPGRHHLRRLHRPPRRRPAPRSQLQPQHQPPASPRPGTLRNRTPPVATVQERAQRGYGGGWGENYTCGGRCRCVWVTPVARTCTRAPSGLLGGGAHLARELEHLHVRQAGVGGRGAGVCMCMCVCVCVLCVCLLCVSLCMSGLPLRLAFG